MNEKNPLVSIVMNCYNSDKYLAKAIDSIYAQTYLNWEIIFWDNASTDKSSNIAKAYDKKMRYFCVDKTTPLGTARNLAVRKTSGKYVAFLDCDDIYLPDKLKHQVSLMESEQCALSYGSAIVINESGDRIGDNKVSNKSGCFLRHLLLNYEINMQSVMLRKSVIEKENLYFDDSLKFSPDYDLLMLLACEYKGGVLMDYIIKYRQSSNSLTNKKIQRWWIENKITLDRVFKRYPDLKVKYFNAYKKSYARVNYLKACYYFDINERKNAINSLSQYKFLNFNFLFLYALSFFGKNAWNVVHKIRKKFQ